MARVPTGLTYANVLATVAIFVSLGGSSYAAITLSKNSVKSKQIKNGQVRNADLARNAVKTGKVADGSLLSADFKAGQLPSGAQGAQGPKGDTGDTGEVGTFALTTQFTQAAADLGDGLSVSTNAFCPAGQRGVAGGARGDATDSEATEVTSSRPAISAANTEPPVDGGTFTGWRATVVNKAGGVVAGIRPEVWVVCAAP